MEPSPNSGFSRGLATCIGVILGLVGGALLLWAWVEFEFYDVCEDTCNKPPRTLSGAVGAALPAALAAVGLLSLACYVLMLRARSGRPSYFKAAVLALLSSGGFSIGLLLFVKVGTSVNGRGALPLFIAVGVILLGIWLLATVAMARRAGRGH
jgi:hypothetical protein